VPHDSAMVDARSVALVACRFIASPPPNGPRLCGAAFDTNRLSSVAQFSISSVFLV
jgi:hypothetical protein